MADIPIISITREDSIEDDDNDNEDEGYNISQAHTDIEDLDSDDNLHRSKSPIFQLQLRRKNSRRISNGATDIEDCHDSDSDDEKSTDNQYEPMISLNEFLDQGYVEEANSMSKTKRRAYSQGVEHKMNNLGIQDYDLGGVTDCENVETSGDEGIVTFATPAKYENFLVDNEDGDTICIQNSVSKNEKAAIISESRVTSDSDLEQPSERRTRRKKNVKTRNVFVYDASDVENIMLTDDDDHPHSSVKNYYQCEFDAEEIVLESSDNETTDSRMCHFPQVDISFAEGNSTTGLRNRKFKSNNMKPSNSKCGLTVSANDDGCTDIENLNSSDDDDDDNEPITKNQLFIPTAYVKSDELPMTDVEDFGSEDEESLHENFYRSDMKMPSPVREITFTKENATGARMSKVMPMNGNLFLGIDESYIDKGMTDTEEMSGKEEDYCDTSKYVVETLPAIDGGVTRNSEYYLPLQSKKAENELESITDTEDINMIRGGVRRRKTKSRNASKKTRNYLEPKEVTNLPVTDTEDLFMDEDHCGKKAASPIFIPLIAPSNDDGLTDVESLSGDEGDVEMRTNELDSAVALAQESFFSTVTSRDISNSENMKFQTLEMPTIRKLTPVPEKCYLTCTDTEEMQTVSDSDDQCLEMQSNFESVTPELHTLLGDSGKSTIYHKNMNRFDKRNERHHIKGHKEYQDAVTDVEYLDDDGNAQNDACKNESKKILISIFRCVFLLMPICARES